MTRADFQRGKLIRNIEFMLTCAWCGEKSEIYTTTPKEATQNFYKEGWRYASDTDMEGIACPDCKRRLKLKVEDVP